MRSAVLLRSALAAVSVAFAHAPLAAPAQEATRILAFGDSNTWGWDPVPEGYPAGRHGDAERWAGVLEAALGEGATVVVDGLVGRTTDLPGDRVGALAPVDFDGRQALAQAVARSMPLDLVLVMLGTNDLQTGRERSPAEVARAAFAMAAEVRSMDRPAFTRYPAPRVMVIAPPPMGDTSTTPLGRLFSAGEQPSRAFGAAFATEAARTGIPFVDAGALVRTDGVDGIHLTAEAHARLGRALVAPVTAVLDGE
jgi:lysophospholipase L1-like esterase